MVREHRRVASAVGILMVLMLVGACVQATKPRPNTKSSSAATTTTGSENEVDEVLESELDSQSENASSDEPEAETSADDSGQTPTPASDTQAETDNDPSSQSSTQQSTSTSTKTSTRTSSTPAPRPAPQASLSVSPPSVNGNFGWYVRVPSVGLASNTDGQVLYRWDSGRWSVYAGRISAPSGAHKLSYYAKDSRGQSQAVQTKTFKVDTAAPSLPTRVRLTAVDSRSVTIAWNASSDRVSGMRRYNIYDGRGVIVGDSRSTRFTLSGLLPGQRVALSVQAEDVAGNRSARAGSLSVAALVPDTTAPKTTLSLSPQAPDGGDGWYVTTPTVTLKRNEAGTTSWWWDSGAATKYSAPFKAVEGKHTLHYRSTDAAGNKESLRSAEIRLDTTAPDTPGLSSTITSTTVTLTWPAVSDSGSGVVRYDLYESATPSVIATFAADASLTTTYAAGANPGYFVRVVDRAGNVSKASATVSGTVETQRRGGRRMVSATTASRRTLTAAAEGAPTITTASSPRIIRTQAESGGGGGEGGSEPPVSRVPAGSTWSMVLLAVLGVGLLALESRRRTA